MTQAERVIAFVERYCMTPEGTHVGKPMKLADFQKDFIRAVFMTMSTARAGPTFPLPGKTANPA